MNIIERNAAVRVLAACAIGLLSASAAAGADFDYRVEYVKSTHGSCVKTDLVPQPGTTFRMDVRFDGPFNQIFGGTWFILLSSTVAFFCSALINNVTNFWLGRFFKRNPNGRLAFAMRSFFSTFLGQFFDNLIFAVLCFMVFAPIFWDGFSWTFVQCVTCSLLGAALELVLEIVFSPIAYRITRIWARENVGKDYFAFQEAKRLEVEE